jgi:Ca2+-transporting ATPase
MTCVALAASAVPESLAATITTLLAVGVNRMVRHKMPVRSLSAVETLGKVSVICTDKTGTLTTNRMTMTQMYAGGHTISLDNETTLSEGEKDFLLMAAMCCDADVQVQDGKEKFIGDHTEAGIVAAVTKHANIDKLTVDSIYPRLCELPFDAYRKLKTSVNMINGKPVAVVKGAADIIISRCDKCDKEAVTKAAEDMAEQALRVIGIAFKPLHEVPANPTEEELEHNLIFGGLVGLEDPPIPETAAAIADAKAAGVRVVMMTGDQEATAIASALRLGIVKKTSGVVINDVLDTMTDEQLDQAINGFGVFVRLTPENKERVVASLQRVGHVVAVTGDRVEDAGVLRLADVGCAMGKGAGVAQEAADVTVEDDNFATIMHGVGVGRGVYANICKTVRVTLGFVLGMGFMMLLSLLFGGGLPFNAVQIMWLNFLVATASVLPLGLELPAKNLLRQPPRTHDEILEKGSITKTLIHGGILAVCAFVAYQLGKETGSGSTMAFLSLGFGQLLCAFSFRSEESLLNFKHHHFNWWLMLSTVLAMVSLVLVFTIPALSTLFGVTTLTAEQKTIVAVTSVAPFIVREIAKFPKSFMNMGKR